MKVIEETDKAQFISKPYTHSHLIGTHFTYSVIENRLELPNEDLETKYGFDRVSALEHYNRIK